MSRLEPVRRLAATLSAALLLATATTAQDERESTTPTAWIWLSGASLSTVNSYISQGYRITDLEIDNAAATAFSVTMVRNSGSYASGWWWYYGASSSQVTSLLAQNNARPIDIETYLDSGGTRRYAVVMVSNTGSAYKPWTLWYGSSTSVISRSLSSNGYRLVDFDGFTSGSSRVYAAIGIPNTGSDARTWYWYVGRTPSQVSTLLSQNRCRLVDLDPVGDGTYDVIMNRVGGAWWWYYGVSLSQANALANQIGARVVDVERRGSAYDVILTNNSNALTTRISSILRSGTNGTLGGFLRRVDGGSSATLASLHADTVFDPASTMKTLLHVHTMRRVRLGSSSLGQTMTTRLGKSGTCPTGGTPTVQEALEAVLQQMMQNSDNCRTRTIHDAFGASAINATAAALGMAGTSLNHYLGCGGPPANRITLADLGRLHDQVADGYLATQRDKFYELMVTSRTYPTVGSTSIDAIIAAEASSLSINSSTLATFRSQVVLAAKGGNYDWPSVPRYHGCYFGFISLPFISSGRVVPREYAFGTFFNDSTNKTAAFNAIGTAYCELLREEIRAALRTWVGATVGRFTYFGSGCAGSAGTPLASATGEPGIGSMVTYSATSAPRNRPAVLYLGSSRARWNGIPLPFDLAPIGAPGCRVYTNPLFGLPGTVSSIGIISHNLRMASSATLIGQEFYAQYYLVDPLANALGMTTTRGITTLLGIGLR